MCCPTLKKFLFLLLLSVLAQQSIHICLGLFYSSYFSMGGSVIACLFCSLNFPSHGISFPWLSLYLSLFHTLSCNIQVLEAATHFIPNERTISTDRILVPEYVDINSFLCFFFGSILLPESLNSMTPI